MRCDSQNVIRQKNRNAKTMQSMGTFYSKNKPNQFIYFKRRNVLPRKFCKKTNVFPTIKIKTVNHARVRTLYEYYGYVFRCESVRASILLFNIAKRKTQKRFSVCFPSAWLFAFKISDIQLSCDRRQ